eukprot:SAG22_NODE_1269_length_4943_cov_2.834434_2_plen_267_part_00
MLTPSAAQRGALSLRQPEIFGGGLSNVTALAAFVFVQVLQVDATTSHVPFQTTLLPDELRQLLPATAPRLAAGLVAPGAARQLYAATDVAADSGGGSDDGGGGSSGPVASLLGEPGAVVEEVHRREVEAGEACSICFDPLAAATTTVPGAEPATEQLDWCRGSCGYSYHRDCLRKWFCRPGAAQHLVQTCPRCRQPWVAAPGGAVDVAPPPQPNGDGGAEGERAAEAAGYVNLGAVSGQAARRDESSYSEWYGVHRRRAAAVLEGL